MNRDQFIRLMGDASKFSPAQRRLRSRYIDLVGHGALPAPLPQWLEPDDPGSLLATAIYNSLVDAGYGERIGWPDDEACWLVGDLDDVLTIGGDAELWTRLRISLDEAHPYCARAWADHGAYYRNDEIDK